MADLYQRVQNLTDCDVLQNSIIGDMVTLVTKLAERNTELEQQVIAFQKASIAVVEKQNEAITLMQKEIVRLGEIRGL